MGSQHLITAADAQHRPPAAHVSLQIHVPALFPHKRQVGKGRLGSGQDHQISVGGYDLARLDEDQLDPRLGRQRVEIVKVGNPRQPQHRDFHTRVGLGGRALVEREHVFGGQVTGSGEERNDA